MYGKTLFGKWVFLSLLFQPKPPSPAGFGRLSESHCSAETCVPHVVLFKPRLNT